MALPEPTRRGPLSAMLATSRMCGRTIAEGSWDAAASLVVARLAGTVSVEDVRRWKGSVERALARIEAGSRFRLIVDLRGYEFAEVAAHKEMRTFVPLTLALYGFRTALLDLFEPLDLALERTRGIICFAAAHVHHDPDKIAHYAQRLARPCERFFTDRGEAEVWIRGLPA